MHLRIGHGFLPPVFKVFLLLEDLAILTHDELIQVGEKALLRLVFRLFDPGPRPISLHLLAHHLTPSHRLLLFHSVHLADDDRLS